MLRHSLQCPGPTVANTFWYFMQLFKYAEFGLHLGGRKGKWDVVEVLQAQPKTFLSDFVLPVMSKKLLDGFPEHLHIHGDQRRNP